MQSGFLFSVPSLALFCERRWRARFSPWLRSENRDRRMRAGRAARPAVEHHRLFRVGSAGVACVDVSGTPPPSGEDALRLSPVWHTCRPTAERQLRHPPSLTKKSERGDVGERPSARVCGLSNLSLSLVPSLAFSCERRWRARFSPWLRSENRDRRMRAGRAARPAVEHHRLSRVGSAGVACVDVSGTPPPSGEDALRLSPGWHTCRPTAARQLRHPPSLTKKNERGDVGERPSARVCGLSNLSLSLVPSLAFSCERRWRARFSPWLRSENRDRQMRAGRAARPAVEHHRLSRVGSAGIACVDVSGTPPPSGEDALRLSPVWHTCRPTAERQLRHPPSLTKKSERGDVGERPSARVCGLSNLSLSLVPSLAFSCERRWRARFSPWLRSENRDRRMRAGRAARPAVEHHRLFRVGSAGIACVDVSGTPPPSGEDALRLSPGWHTCRPTAARQLRQPPSLTEKSERGDKQRKVA